MGSRRVAAIGLGKMGGPMALHLHEKGLLAAIYSPRTAKEFAAKNRLPNTLNVAFPNYVGADILARLDGVAASTGSACHSGRVELSPVLAAMGIRPEVGMGAIRFSLGRYTAIEEIDAVVDRLTDVLAAGSHLNAKPPGLVEGTGRCSL